VIPFALYTVTQKKSSIFTKFSDIVSNLTLSLRIQLIDANRKLIDYDVIAFARINLTYMLTSAAVL